MESMIRKMYNLLVAYGVFYNVLPKNVGVFTVNLGNPEARIPGPNAWSVKELVLTYHPEEEGGVEINIVRKGVHLVKVSNHGSRLSVLHDAFTEEEVVEVLKLALCRYLEAQYALHAPQLEVPAEVKLRVSDDWAYYARISSKLFTQSQQENKQASGGYLVHTIQVRGDTRTAIYFEPTGQQVCLITNQGNHIEFTHAAFNLFILRGILQEIGRTELLRRQEAEPRMYTSDISEDRKAPVRKLRAEWIDWYKKAFGTTETGHAIAVGAARIIMTEFALADQSNKEWSHGFLPPAGSGDVEILIYHVVRERV